MKTSRLGSMRPWRVFHRPRLRATPGWFCSLASTVFFEAEAFAADECPDGAVVDPQPAPGKFGHQSAQGERRRRPGDKPRPMGARDLRRHMAANLARRDAQRPQPLRPLHHARRRDAQRPRHLPHALARRYPRHARSRKSIDRGLTIAAGLQPGQQLESETRRFGNPRPIQTSLIPL